MAMPELHTHSHDDNNDAGDDTAFRIQCLTAAAAVDISRIHREIMFSV